ncbi:NHL DOMAIN PROTEIN [Salix koriyanagi]|uniref:NHL DOMAIN PROTEIN n=1 Tax=Salix koriyanagi TaxID=2511006 RepID=A0A9Q0Q7S5_9ROSI|nr:NHL DOMAIN PROTEIN [Salix koriyanagi]
MSSQTPDMSPSYDNSDDFHDLAFAKRRCCWIPCLATDPVPSSSGAAGPEFWQRIKPVDCTTNRESWWFRGWMKIREWSELVAGPRWKTLLRRFNKKPGGGVQYGKFQYDPSSYALNFDQGSKRRHADDDLFGRSFSSRYSLPPSRN